MLLTGLKLLHLFSGQKITVIHDRRISTDQPVIFASTHAGWDDPPVVWSAIGDHAYVFWGDPGYSYKTTDGFFMDLNGVICCDTASKSDRYIAKETCVKWLQEGGNLLIFPEGAWNVTENLPVMPLFSGAAEMAIRTGAQIIPLAFEKYGKEYVVNIGKNISPADFSLFQKQALTDLLRDTLASLKWDIWAYRPEEARSAVPEDYSAQFLQGFVDQMLDESYSLEAIERTRFHTREEIAYREVSSCLSRLIPGKYNAFLFRKK